MVYKLLLALLDSKKVRRGAPGFLPANGDGNDNDNDNCDNGTDDPSISPEDLSLFVEDELNNNNNQQHNLLHTNNQNSPPYCCKVWALAPAPLPLVDFGDKHKAFIAKNIHEGQQQPAVSTTEQASKALVATSNRHTLDLPGLQSYFWRKGLCLLPKSVVFLSSWCQENGADKDRDGSSSGSRHRCPSLPDLSEISCLVDEAIAGAEALIQLGIWIGEDAFFFREIASQLEHRFDLKFRGTTSSMQACLGSGPWKTENGPCSDVGDNDYDNKIPELLGLLILGMETINDPHSVEQPDCWEMDLPVVYSITKMLIAIRKDKKHGGHNLLNPVSVEHRRGQGHRGQ
eukprot:CAMPEP_0201126112 /NCGR_PEP_ID=MMETSP0850-20130426/24711_1 /ASSEMBLY_ACC=CAM_ASM_000622 /TAXON_ID=183588 /ORGANISM="Pseudo-nitzschia fraudulenta, Strain WWA7" /LENGTH=343 /DNA_ID=CAMNT_0047394399 /DNA_START=5 /DNA_END=1038 /DNA_ORIENTATION=+